MTSRCHLARARSSQSASVPTLRIGSSKSKGGLNHSSGPPSRNTLCHRLSVVYGSTFSRARRHRERRSWLRGFLTAPVVRRDVLTALVCVVLTHMPRNPSADQTRSDESDSPAHEITHLVPLLQVDLYATTPDSAGFWSAHRCQFTKTVDVSLLITHPSSGAGSAVMFLTTHPRTRAQRCSGVSGW